MELVWVPAKVRWTALQREGVLEQLWVSHWEQMWATLKEAETEQRWALPLVQEWAQRWVAGSVQGLVRELDSARLHQRP